MRVEYLSLNHFRNYENAEFEFGGGLQLFLGKNGQGKTNLVEAVSYFNSLSSHRVSNDLPLIHIASDFAVVRMKVSVKNRSVLLDLAFEKKKPKRAKVNGNSVRTREVMQWFTCVLFAPEDLSIVRGEPQNRRDFLDELIVTRNPAMAQVFSEYAKVVKQRNSLLKSLRQGASESSVFAQLPIWDIPLIDLGSRIMLERRKLLLAMRELFQKKYWSLTKSSEKEVGHRVDFWVEESVFNHGNVSRETLKNDLSWWHQSARNVSRETLCDEFQCRLLSARDKESIRGLTLIGPHRDELHFALNDLPVKGYASHGETWSFVLALRLAFAELIRGEGYIGDPVLILDDVFAELDALRRKRLMDEMSDYEQVIVTAAVEEDIPEIGRWNIFDIQNAVVSARERDGLDQNVVEDEVPVGPYDENKGGEVKGVEAEGAEMDEPVQDAEEGAGE